MTIVNMVERVQTPAGSRVAFMGMSRAAHPSLRQ